MKRGAGEGAGWMMIGIGERWREEVREWKFKVGVKEGTGTEED